MDDTPRRIPILRHDRHGISRWVGANAAEESLTAPKLWRTRSSVNFLSVEWLHHFNHCEHFPLNFLKEVAPKSGRMAPSRVKEDIHRGLETRHRPSWTC